MKKFLYIFSIAVFGLLSCKGALEVDSPATVDGFGEEDAPTVLLTFAVPSRVRTRALGEKPAIQRMHVAVFNANGYLKEFKEATLMNVGLVNAGGEAEDVYSVEVQMAATKRVLHFIANSPVTDRRLLATTSGEANVLSSLFTSLSDTQNPSDAYWQRIELEHGIQGYKYPGGKLDPEFVYETPSAALIIPTYEDAAGNVLDPDDEAAIATAVRYKYSSGNHDFTVYQGDYIKRDGSKVTDATGYIADRKIEEIPLIRNFARITIDYDRAHGNFVPEKFTILNAPSRGYVAPYDFDNGAFVSAYTDAETKTDLTYSAVSATHYKAPMPTGSVLLPPPADEEDDDAFLAPGEYFYMYERPLPSATVEPVYILVQGMKEMAAGGDPQLRWFKIELTDATGAYMPIYRGVGYDFIIGEIAGSDGYHTMQQALDNPPVGDVSNSVATANLTSISKGGVTLWVEYIGNAHIGDADTVPLLYKFYKDGDPTDTDELTATVTLSLSPYQNVPAAVSGIKDVNDNPGVGAPYSGNGPDGRTGWYQTIVSRTGTGDVTKKTDLIVSGTYNGTTLGRTVIYTVLKKQKFQKIENSGLSTDKAGDETTVTVTLPPLLPFGMFPLTLLFESNNNNLNPGENMPVSYGKSLFSQVETTDVNYRTNSSFYFEKTVSWSDYYDEETDTYTYDVTARFKTSYDDAVTGDDYTTVVAVGDKDGYFDISKTTLYKEVFTVTPSSQTVKGSAGSAEFRIYGDNTGQISNFQWNITNVTGDNNVRVDPTSGTATEVVTMSFDPITDPTATGNDYSATVNYSYTDAEGEHSGSVLVTVHQSALEHKVVTVTKNNVAFTLSNNDSIYLYDDDHSNANQAAITLTRSNFSYNNNGYYYNGNGTPRTMTFTPAPASGDVSAITITSIVLSFTPANGQNYYNPTSITTNANSDFSTPAGTSTWTGERQGALVATFACRGTDTRANNRQRRTQITSITVSYYYTISSYE